MSIPHAGARSPPGRRPSGSSSLRRALTPSADLYRYIERALAAPHQQRDFLARLLRADKPVELLHAFEPALVHGHDDVARTDRCPGELFGDVGDDQPVIHAERLALLRRKLADREAEAARLHPLAGFGGTGGGVRGRRLAYRDLQVLLLAFAHDAQLGLLTRLGARDQARQLVRLVDTFSVVGHDYVAQPQARLLGRRADFDVDDDDAVRVVDAERLRELLRQRLDPDAEPAARHLAGLAKLARDVERRFDRDGERNAHIPAGAAVDHRVDADDLAREVDERAPRVARVNRDVGLDERDVGL